MSYSGSLEDQDVTQKYYNYTKGTNYYLANRYGDLKPITVDITYDGNEFTFTPDYVITESEAGSNTAKITDRSLLSGVTKLMTMITSFCGIRSMFNKNKKDQQFIIKQDYSKCDVTLYIDYTNNMIFPDDNQDKYKLLKNYIFPNSRIPSYSSGFAKITLPKDLIKIEYSTNLNYIKRDGLLYDNVKLYKKFLEVFKDKDLTNTLSELEIKEQIDNPTKLIIYGVCDKFGKYKGYEGICAILYIEHKITLDDYLKFKKICDEKLNEYLAPLNLTTDDIKNMTSEKVKKEFNTFQKIENLAIRCGWLADPRGQMYNKIVRYDYYLYNERTSYSNDAGLSRWKAIKKYYPELFNGLKIILDYYLEVKDEYNANFQKEYDTKFNIAANDAYNNIVNSNDDITDKRVILKYIINYINSLKDDIKLQDFEDLCDFFVVLNQNILDIVNEIYTNQYRQRVKDYKIAHPKARQMELIFDNDIFVTSHVMISNYNDIFKYEPFKYEYLQKEIQKVLDQPEFKTVKNTLNNFNLTFTVKQSFLINNKILDYRRTTNNYKKYMVNINDAINSLEVVYTTDPAYDVFNNDDLMKQIIKKMLISPISLKVKWFKHDYGTKFNLVDPTIHYMPGSISQYSNVYNSEMTSDDLINKLINNDKDINNYLDFKIIFEYDNPQLIADNLKSILQDTK